MTITFIGDVHGQLDALDGILPACEGQIVFMGDLIDRGPDSRGVVARVRALCEEGKASCILGNHEFALVSSLGLPEANIDAKPHFFSSWCQVYGGFNTLLSYDVQDLGLQGLRDTLIDDLRWMHSLPWYLEGAVGERRWLAVHAGLNNMQTLKTQLAGLNDIDGWWQSVDQLPPALYEHKRAHQNPPDLAEDICVVSGHTVMPEVVIEDQRLLCDTSGGRPGRQLSAVIWPEGRVITAPTADPEDD